MLIVEVMTMTQAVAEKLTKVVEGERFTVTHVCDMGDRVKLGEAETYRVFPKCEHNNGKWACATHAIRFSNQFGKDSHIHTGRHKLAWFCSECGSMQVP